MENILNPILHILPSPQLKLWHELSTTPKDFILYGGTAIALRLGHRVSVDFDFFSPKPFDSEELYRTIPYLLNAKIVQNAKNTLTCAVNRDGEVLISFFGGLPLGQINPPSIAESNKLQVATLSDLAGTKAAVIQKRVELKDYLDIYALLNSGKLSLDYILACGKAVYGNAFNPYITLKALSYYNDPELSELSPSIKEMLINAVEKINLANLPAISSGKLGDV